MFRVQHQKEEQNAKHAELEVMDVDDESKDSTTRPLTPKAVDLIQKGMDTSQVWLSLREL